MNLVISKLINSKPKFINHQKRLAFSNLNQSQKQINKANKNKIF
jgi:hypothetical protein